MTSDLQPFDMLHSKRFYLGVAVCFLVLWASWIWSFLGAMELENYLRDVNCDDSFYYFEIARNVAAGHGSTFDQISSTNGYHPLWLVLLVPVYGIIDDPVGALEAIKTLEFLLLALGSLLVLVAAFMGRWEAPLLLLLPLHFLNYEGFYLGLEGAAHLVVIAWVMVSLCWYFRSSGKSAALISLTGGLMCLPWVRLESLAFAVAVVVGWTVYAQVRPHAVVKRHVWVSGGALLLSASLYFVGNYALFGSAVPISGRVKSFFAQVEWEKAGGYDVWTSLQGTLGHRIYVIGLVAALVACLVVIACWLSSTYRSERYRVEHAFDILVIGLGLSHVARTVFAVLFGHPKFINYSWYFVPGVLLAYLLGPLLVHRALLLLEVNRRLPAAGRWLAVALSLVVISVTYDRVQGMNPWQRLRAWESNKEIDWEIGSFEGAKWLSDNVDETTLVGATDAGVLGYFSSQQVVNLDGLVNSTAYFEVKRSQRVEEWLRDRHLTLFANVLSPDVECDVLQKRTRQEASWNGNCEVLYRSDHPTQKGRVFTVLQYNH